ncbi:MAG: hypothetical protein ABJB16_13175 [Saprospiraceae bacterium]
MNNLELFRKEYLQANTWAQRKDGAPLYLLDKLSTEELKSAEIEMIQSLSPGDTWPIIGLGHIKSKDALPKLYKLLDKGEKKIKVTIAHSIFQICQDQKMIDIVLEETTKTTHWSDLIDILYLLPAFQDERVMTMLNDFRHHKEYLVAYNATRALGLPTDEVVEKFKVKKPEGK